MSKFRLIFKYYLLEKKLLATFLFFGVLVTALDLTTPIIVKEIIDVVMPAKDMNRLILLCGIVLVLYIIRATSLVISSSRGQLMGNKMKFYLRNDLTTHFLKQSRSFFNEKNSGELISRITGDLESVSTLLYRGLEDSLSATLSLVGSFILMLRFSPTLACITFIPLPFVMVFVVKLNIKLKKGYMTIRNENSKFTSVMSDIFRVIFFIKDNNLEEENKFKFLRANEELLESERKNFLNSAFLMSGVVFYTQFIQMLLILVGGILHIKTDMGLGIIFSFLLLVDRFKVAIMRFMGLIDLYQRGIVGIHRFNEAMEIDTTLEDGHIDLQDKFESLEFKNVYFEYKPGKYILEDVNFKITKGQKVAIGGQSGVGKTTIFNLMKRSYLPTKGDIFINDINMKDIKTESLLKIIGVINRENNLFNTSIMENIKIAAGKDCLDEKVIEAAKKACIHDKIMSFNEDYKTLLGISGINMSGGEEQRLNLARIFLKEAKLVMLDEATSGLDNIVETEIMENIKTVFSDETVVTITHKLSLLKDYDNIILIDGGRVHEEGNYDSLMEAKGKFYKIVNS